MLKEPQQTACVHGFYDLLFMHRHGVSEDVLKDLKFDTGTVMFEWELMIGTVNFFFSIKLCHLFCDILENKCLQSAETSFAFY